MIRLTVIPMIAVFGLVGAAQAEVQLSKKTLVKIVQSQNEAAAELVELLDASVFRQELSEMESALGRATAAVLSRFKSRSSSTRDAAADRYQEAVSTFQDVGTQTSSRWPDEVLKEFVQPIEHDWRAYMDHTMEMLEADTQNGRLTAKEERLLRQLPTLVEQIEEHVHAVRGELLPASFSSGATAEPGRGTTRSDKSPGTAGGLE